MKAATEAREDCHAKKKREKKRRKEDGEKTGCQVQVLCARCSVKAAPTYFDFSTMQIAITGYADINSFNFNKQKILISMLFDT